MCFQYLKVLTLEQILTYSKSKTVSWRWGLVCYSERMNTSWKSINVWYTLWMKWNLFTAYYGYFPISHLSNHGISSLFNSFYKKVMCYWYIFKHPMIFCNLLKSYSCAQFLHVYTVLIYIQILFISINFIFYCIAVLWNVLIKHL